MQGTSWKSHAVFGLLVVSLGAAFFTYLWSSGPRDFRFDLPPCFEAGAPFHHRLVPGCRTKVRTPQGRVEFQTNDDGIRDLPHDLVLSLGRRIFLLGDSFVEGWWLREDQALNTQLRELDPRQYYINGGLRASGPLFQAPRLWHLLERYRPQELWVFLNDTDVADDRLACALADQKGAEPARWEFRADDLEPDGWQRFLLQRFEGWRLQGKLRNLFERSARNRIISSGAAESCEPCLGLRSLQTQAAAKKVPLRAFLLDLGERGHRVFGKKFPEAAATLEGCLRELQIPYFALRLDELTPEEQDKYLWAGDVHFNPLGAEYWATRIHEAGAPSVKPAKLQK